MITRDLLIAEKPSPPHDPTSWRLNKSLGWKFAASPGDPDLLSGDGNSICYNVYPHPIESYLSLGIDPSSDRSLLEENGSFGGLTLASNLAKDSHGNLFLLDRDQSLLKWFDDCKCEFVAVKGIGGEGSEARQFLNPTSLHVYRDDLYICDPDNNRISVFSLPQFALRAQLKFNGPAGLWNPIDMAFDHCGRAYVSDSNHSFIWVIGASGFVEDQIAVEGPASHLCVDKNGLLYAAIESTDRVLQIDPDSGEILATMKTAGEIYQAFSPPKEATDSMGRHHLSGYCKDGNDDNLVFDESGTRLNGASSPNEITLVSEGRYISAALDSKIPMCTWHRVLLKGSLEEGTRLRVSTFTADTLWSNEDLAQLPESQWDTKLVVLDFEGGLWDGLIRGKQGRYLWLRIEFVGNGKMSPLISSIEVEFPRISLKRYLPAVFGEDPLSSDFTDRFLSIFDSTIRSIEGQVDKQAALFDPLSAPSTRVGDSKTDMLSWLASWIGAHWDERWSEDQRRRFLKKASYFASKQGTRDGLRELLIFFLGFEECEVEERSSRCGDACSCHSQTRKVDFPPLILEHFQLRRWMFLGSGRLGDNAKLWADEIVNRTQLREDRAQLGATELNSTPDPYRDPMHLYANKFSVFVPSWIEEDAVVKRSLESLIDQSKPAHTQHQTIYVAPRFRIGKQSVIGYDAVVGRYPEEVFLNQQKLGQDTVLSGKKLEGSVQIGKSSTVGSDTFLN